jgi:hypothetical protein
MDFAFKRDDYQTGAAIFGFSLTNEPVKPCSLANGCVPAIYIAAIVH